MYKEPSFSLSSAVTLNLLINTFWLHDSLSHVPSHFQTQTQTHILSLSHTSTHMCKYTCSHASITPKNINFLCYSLTLTLNIAANSLTLTITTS